MLTIESLRRAKAALDALDAQPVPDCLCAWVPSVAAKAYCDHKGIEFAPDKNGVIMIGDVMVFITDMRRGCFASDAAIIEAFNSDA